MSINYQKVGWDTTKYFNPTNMNQMDNGIKAACDKADANEAAIADVNSKLGNTDISAIGDGTVTGGLNALNSNLNAKLKTIEIQCTSGSTKFGDFYYVDFNIEPYINSYGKVISAIPISATNNDCFSAYYFSNFIRVLTLSPNSTTIIRITHSKTS